MRLYKSRSSYSTPRPSANTDGARYHARSHYSHAAAARHGSESGAWRDPDERSKIKHGLPVFLAFCVVLGMALPVFFGQIGRVVAPEGETLVRVVASQGGSVWSGRLAFKLGGAEQWAGSSVPYEVVVHPGVYTVAMTGGGPPGSTLQRVGPTGSQLGRASETITFTLELSSPSASGS
jgi:hypothetical protein